MGHTVATAEEKLRSGAGQVFHGDCMEALAKAVLQSGAGYAAGCRHVSPLLDALSEAPALLDELGVHLEHAADEAGAATMLAASIRDPLRGVVNWTSIAGTNVAAGALSNIASAGVKGGALVVVSGDYGEGAVSVQERSHAVAMKSQLWLLDPRPDLQCIADVVEKGFRLSEATGTPVMLELRRRASRMSGSFTCKDNRAPAFSRKNPTAQAAVPAGASAQAQEKHKLESRLPAALKFIREQRLNEFFDGAVREVGIILQGGLYTTVVRALQQLGLADAFGASPIPLYVLNVVYPLVPDELTRFCAGKRAVLVVEEGQPDFIEQAINAILRRADINDTFLIGKEVLPACGEYTGEAVLSGIAQFMQLSMPDGVDHMRIATARDAVAGRRKEATAEAALLPEPLPARVQGTRVDSTRGSMSRDGSYTRFGVDEDLCGGDRAAVRKTRCPSLTLKDSSDPLQADPVAAVDERCTGCGACAEATQAAALGPLFYEVGVIRNAGGFHCRVDRLRRAVIGWLQRHAERGIA